MRCGNDGYIISFLVGHKKPIWLKIISVIVLKTCETEGEKHCKALKIKVFANIPIGLTLHVGAKSALRPRFLFHGE